MNPITSTSVFRLIAEAHVPPRSSTARSQTFRVPYIIFPVKTKVRPLNSIVGAGFVSGKRVAALRPSGAFTPWLVSSWKKAARSAHSSASTTPSASAELTRRTRTSIGQPGQSPAFASNQRPRWVTSSDVTRPSDRIPLMSPSASCTDRSRRRDSLNPRMRGWASSSSSRGGSVGALGATKPRRPPPP